MKISFTSSNAGTDFVGLTAQAMSDPVTIDATPPAVTAGYTLDVGGSFIQSSSSVSVR